MKFAYLIIAHNEPYVLNCLIEMLDYIQNDIYLLIDKKSNLINIDNIYRVNNASLHILDRVNISWGGMSQIGAIYKLIDAASTDFHDYYHLISGVDLPLMSQADMQSFFSDNYGKEFIGVIPNYTDDKDLAGRFEWFWLWQDDFGCGKMILVRIRQKRLNLLSLV